ncbi:MAG TPA: nitronate monooxygenase [Mycobacteriales bacterium]|jgi:nitronate monooxygenase|nr:nitronate monooxygenase [Mycobacteriales bacterium]
MSAVLAALRRPVIAAPMGGGPSTPRLVHAVGSAGGMGFLAGGYLTPARFAEDVDRVRALGPEPYGVNLFVPGPPLPDDSAVRAYAARLEPEARRLGVHVGEPVFDDDAYDEKLAVLWERPPAVVSFAFGPPSARTVRTLRARGSEVWVTVTNPDAATDAEALGVDALVVQGVEAGAHRGGADDTDDLALLPLLRLVAARTPLPLVGSGGIVDGAGLAAALVAGASAAQLGTAFLRCPEAGTAAVHREAIVSRTPTELTRAFTGRRARGIVNRFLREHEDAPVGYPAVHHVTSPMRAAARAAHDPEVVNLWAGQTHELARELPAAEVVGKLLAEARAAAAALAARADSWV